MREKIILSDRQRTIMLMLLQDKLYVEIAATFDIPEATVRSEVLAIFQLSGMEDSFLRKDILENLPNRLN